MDWICAHVIAAVCLWIWTLLPGVAMATSLEGATLWRAVRERFPELALSEDVSPTVRVATDRASLQEALTAAVDGGRGGPHSLGWSNFSRMDGFNLSDSNDGQWRHYRGLPKSRDGRL